MLQGGVEGHSSSYMQLQEEYDHVMQTINDGSAPADTQEMLRMYIQDAKNGGEVVSRKIRDSLLCRLQSMYT